MAGMSQMDPVVGQSWSWPKFDLERREPLVNPDLIDMTEREACVFGRPPPAALSAGRIPDSASQVEVANQPVQVG